MILKKLPEFEKVLDTAWKASVEEDEKISKTMGVTGPEDGTTKGDKRQSRSRSSTPPFGAHPRKR
ncbi:MAG: hypothetical protein M1836_000648 [Candelina mexicana]|nr:MAG: hypothetical protein M1836_000648 [Candelina mexicana]